jgi:hypothetical protein
VIRRRHLTPATGALVLFTLAFAACAGETRIEQARGILGDGDRFETGRSSVEAMARVTSLLRADAEECTGDHGKNDARCAARSEAYAVMQVTAVAIGQCTRPDRDATRRKTSDYLARVARVERGGKRPTPPFPPRC